MCRVMRLHYDRAQDRTQRLKNVLGSTSIQFMIGEESWTIEKVFKRVEKGEMFPIELVENEWEILSSQIDLYLLTRTFILVY
jgi:hypothetical protein